jgi:hypothetical protein
MGINSIMYMYFHSHFHFHLSKVDLHYSYYMHPSVRKEKKKTDHTLPNVTLKQTTFPKRH